MANNKILVNEGHNYNITFSIPEDTTGETISARILVTSGSGTGTSVGSVSGSSANTQLTIQLGIKTYTPAEYYLELWADYGGANQRIVSPAPNTTYILKIQDRFGSSN